MMENGRFPSMEISRSRDRSRVEGEASEKGLRLQQRRAIEFRTC